MSWLRRLLKPQIFFCGQMRDKRSHAKVTNSAWRRGSCLLGNDQLGARGRPYDCTTSCDDTRFHELGSAISDERPLRSQYRRTDAPANDQALRKVSEPVPFGSF